jgi:hypothetical protein
LEYAADLARQARLPPNVTAAMAARLVRVFRAERVAKQAGRPFDIDDPDDWAEVVRLYNRLTADAARKATR